MDAAEQVPHEFHQDVAVPFMTQPCWEPDTLFLIFEEDFRFEPENEDREPSFIKGSVLQEVVGAPPPTGSGDGTPITRGTSGSTTGS